MRFTITNGITMDVEITKSDLKTVLSKNVRNNKFNAIKNALAKDIRGYIERNLFKPYAIIDEHTFNAGISELRK